MIPVRIAVTCRKGGTGKTTTACGVAAILAEAGHRVLICDLDQQSNVAFGLGVPLNAPGTAALLLNENPAPIEADKNLWVLPGNPDLVDRRITELEPEDLLEALKPLDYDVVVFDCAPGDAHLERLALAAANVTLIVADAHAFGLIGAERIVEILNDRKRKGRAGAHTWAIVLSRLDKRRAADKQFHEAASIKFPGIPQLMLHQDNALAAASMERQPITKFAPDCRGIDDLKEIAKWAHSKASQIADPDSVIVAQPRSMPVSEPAQGAFQ